MLTSGATVETLVDETQTGASYVGEAENPVIASIIRTISAIRPLAGRGRSQAQEAIVQVDYHMGGELKLSYKSDTSPFVDETMTADVTSVYAELGIIVVQQAVEGGRAGMYTYEVMPDAHDIIATTLSGVKEFRPIF